MKNTALIIILLLIVIPSLSAQEIMPLEDVERGMKGVVYSTFEGTTIEQVEAVVEGIYPNAIGTKMDMIVVRLLGDRMEWQGATEGMSGSPFYIDGKLVGAVSYRLADFPKDPLAGVTHISYMLDVPKGGRGTPTLAMDYHRLYAASPLAKTIGTAFGFSDLFEGGASTLNRIHSSVIPLFSGFNYSGMASRTLSTLGWLDLSSTAPIAGKGTLSQGNSQQNNSLKPGSLVVASLITGDLMFGATGTVTHVDGNKILAFGHPFNQYGSVDYFMQSAEMITVLTSLRGSANLTRAGAVIGRVVEDRTAGIYGIVGEKAGAIPVTVTICYEGDPVETYNFEMVEQKNFVPGMLAIIITNCIYSTQPQLGEMSANVSGSIQLKGLPSVEFNNFFSGMAIPIEAGILPSLLSYMLANNDFKPVAFESVNVTVDMLPGMRMAKLEKAWLTRQKVRPGESFELVVEYKPTRQRNKQHREKYYIPETIQPGKYQIVVGNGSSIIAHENSMVEGQTSNSSLEQMIQMMNRLRTKDKIYAQTMRSEEGMYYHGTFFPNLPASKRSVTTKNIQNTAIATLTGSVMDERNVKTGLILEGTTTLSFEVIE